MRSLLMLFPLATFLVASPAAAAVLHTPPIQAGYGGTTLVCHARNVSGSARSVTIDLLNFTGNVVAGKTYDIPAGQEQALVGSAKPSAASCRFTVGNAANIRASASYYHMPDYELDLVIPAD